MDQTQQQEALNLVQTLPIHQLLEMRNVHVRFACRHYELRYDLWKAVVNRTPDRNSYTRKWYEVKASLYDTSYGHSEYIHWALVAAIDIRLERESRSLMSNPVYRLFNPIGEK